jgi:hypothetical protein
MARLIITFDASAAGTLKVARLADRVLALDRRLVWGPLPSMSELEDSFRSDGVALAEFCRRFDAIELWADPEPNAQLQLLRLLDHLGRDADVTARLSIAQADSRIGEEEPAGLRPPPRVPVHRDHLEIAGAAWAAWRAPSPTSWFGLLAQDISALPKLRSSVMALLEELPMRSSGLGATEMRMLELVAAGHVRPSDLFPGQEKLNTRRTYYYWEVGALLDGLARCPQPALSGLAEGPFDDALHDSEERFHRYKASRLALTDLGTALLAHSDDFTRHNPIHRWWGGTELTNDRLWRWDPDERKLLAP